MYVVDALWCSVKMSKRTATAVPVLQKDSVVYVKFDLSEGRKKWSVWYKGTVVNVIRSDDCNICANIDFPDDNGVEEITLDKSKYGCSGTWSVEEPVSFKKQKVVGNEKVCDIDYDQIIEKVAERIMAEKKNLLEVSEDKIQKLLETVVEKFLKEKPSESFIHGDITSKVIQLYNSLPKHEIAMYQGNSMMSGVVDKIKKAKGKVMCAYYKNLQNVCASKEQIAQGDKMYYVSKEAVSVHLARFSDDKIRTTHSDRVYDTIKHLSLCAKCVSRHCTSNLFMDFGKRKEVCCICKIKRLSKQQNSADNQIPVCTECTGANNPVQDKECYFKNCLQLLPKIFHDHNMTVENTKTVTIDKSGRSRFIDFVIQGKFKNNRFLIILEMDQNEHLDYNQSDERKKMAEQVAFMMKDNSYDKLFIVRFNNNAAWSENKQPMNYYNTTERALILRSWVIWFLLNLDVVRTTTILYLWYSDHRKRDLFEPSFEGFGMTNHAPKNPLHADWYYCAEPSEVMYEWYDNINNRRVDFIDVFRFWKKEHEKDAIPTSIQAIMASTSK